jgi:AcrR family transcriptional regulator
MPRGKQNQEQLSKIYEKALDLFVKYGYSSTSTASIAKACGMSQGNLFHYCRSKENLLYQIHMRDLQTRFIPILEEAERVSDPDARIALFLRKFTLMITSSKVGQVFIHEVRSLSKSHQNEILAIWRRGYDLIRGAIEELQMAGRARNDRESFLTFLGIGMAFWTIYWWDYSRQTNSEEFAETLIHVFRKGLLSSGNGEE